MSILDVYFGWIGSDEFEGEGFTAFPFAVEAATSREAVEKTKAFLEEVAELAEAHPGIELVDGMRAIHALGIARQTRIAGRQNAIAARARRQ